MKVGLTESASTGSASWCSDTVVGSGADSTRLGACDGGSEDSRGVGSDSGNLGDGSSSVDGSHSRGSYAK